MGASERFNLKTDEGLRQACELAGREENWEEERHTWHRQLAETLRRIRGADRGHRAERDFAQWLWEENHVAAVGQGNISVEKALDDQGFREWLADRSMASLPEDPEERIETLSEFYEEMVGKLAPFCRRNPKLKILRVLAALYPEVMTTVADRRALRHLSAAMDGPVARNRPIETHLWIRDRLDRLLGPVPANGYEALAKRMALPWLLFARYVAPEETDPVELPTGKPGEMKLVPLPAARRRRGLTALRGSVTTVLGLLDFARDAPSREDLLEHIRGEFSDYKRASLGMVINILQSELGVLKNVDNHYSPTDRGEAFLETQDPSELSDWLLTRILGVDHALVELRDRGPRPWGQLVEIVQRVNPGWSTKYAPSSTLNWLRTMEVVDKNANGVASLTDTGRSWAEQIHWQPEVLPKEQPEETIADPIEELETQSELARPALPDFDAILAAVEGAGRFPTATVAQLHAGLWAHERRHFAVLTGLSGSGKTLLAREYGKALVPKGASPREHLITIAVQPGWYDPGALLGYVNPLKDESYVRTPFLEFLLAASDKPDRPFVAILDEMNLSHPEQYLAPLLSAMETGARISFHSEGDLFDGVPPSIVYPANLVLIGTVNMDETTHGLSDKVLDRAFVLEFWEIDLDEYPRWGSRALSDDDEKRAKAALRDLMAALSPARMHFGWRVVDDVLDFLALSLGSASPLPVDDALDSVVYAKVVPKLRGDDSPRFRDALAASATVLERHGLLRSRAKVEELRRDLEATGSARFWR